MSSRLRFAIVTTLTILAVTITFSLGRWQLSRAAEKERLQHQMESRRALPEIQAGDLLAAVDPAPLLERRVSLRGRWLADRTIYLDNRQMNGRVGFFVLTPLALEGDGPVVMVQRGWAARDFQERSRLPPVTTPAGIVEMRGQLVPQPSRTYALGQSETGAIRQNLDMAAFASEIGRSLLPISIRETGPSSEGLVRDWPDIAAGVEKHHGYAFQWFGLCALVVLLYVWFQIVRRFIQVRAS